ncbi:hypothetical protein ETW24_08785 [Leisingera sp. NJS204]|nr:hypothetical protein ETW24_08785 [Leisingera sp. NJS204]
MPLLRQHLLQQKRQTLGLKRTDLFRQDEVPIALTSGLPRLPVVQESPAGQRGTRKYHDAIAARDIHAVILPRKSAKPWKPASAGIFT